MPQVGYPSLEVRNQSLFLSDQTELRLRELKILAIPGTGWSQGWTPGAVLQARLLWGQASRRRQPVNRVYEPGCGGFGWGGRLRATWT